MDAYSFLVAATCYDPVVIILSNVHMMGRKNISQEGKSTHQQWNLHLSSVGGYLGARNKD